MNDTTKDMKVLTQSVSDLFEALQVQKQMLLSPAGQTIRKELEVNPNSEYYQRKVLEFVSDMSEYMTCQMQAMGEIGYLLVDTGLYTGPDTNINEVFEKIHPGYMAMFEEITEMGQWLSSYTNDEDFLEKLMVIGRPDEGNFLDYSGKAEDPLEPRN